MRIKGKSNDGGNTLSEIYLKDINQSQLMLINKGGFA
jgi:hypothetical protein